jgi:hypothetical protein
MNSQGQKSYLCDGYNHEGFSGSPLFVERIETDEEKLQFKIKENYYDLKGVVSGYVTEEDEEANLFLKSGIFRVVDADHITENLDIIIEQLNTIT